VTHGVKQAVWTGLTDARYRASGDRCRARRARAGTLSRGLAHARASIDVPSLP